MIHLLNFTNIDIVSEEITHFLSEEGVSSKETLRTRLSVEEVLLRYLNQFGENKSFKVITSKRFRTIKVELQIAGDSINPFEGDDNSDAIMNRLLSSYGLAPEWRYKNGKNIISFITKKKKKISQVMQMGIAIASALVLSLICKALPENVSNFITADLVTPVFNTFMGLLSAIAGPIIFLSVVWGICGIGDMVTFGKIGKKMIGRFLIDSVIVGATSAVFCIMFFEISSSGTTSFVFSDLYQMILDIIPSNFVTPFVEGNSLQIIFLAFVVGLTMLFLNNRIPVVMSFIDQMNIVMQTIMSAVSSFIPFFVFGSVLNMTVGNNLSMVAKSSKLILVMLLGDFLLMTAFVLLISIRKKVNSFVFVKKLLPTFVIGLTTASSVAAFQTNINTCETKLGIDKKLVDIGIPLGQVVFMPGAIMLFLCAAFGMAETFGVAITPAWMVTAAIISVVLAIAAPPIPGAALTCYTILFMQLSIPNDAIAVIIALNIILEFVATAANLFCLQSEMVYISDALDLLDEECLRKQQ